jgi:opacity protein-like surface antigen
MKKIALTSLLALFAVSGAHAADWFVGGSLGYNYDEDVATTWNISPEIGYHLDDKWDIGFQLNYSDSEDETINETLTEYGVGVFARYNIVSFGDFKILAKGTAFVSKTDAEVSGADFDWTSYGIDVVPMVTYDISESFTLFAELNFLGAGFEKTTGDIEGTSAGFNFDSNNVANTNDFQIGFTYNF